jgi:hypothetical protein
MDLVIRPRAKESGGHGGETPSVYPVTALEDLVREKFNPFGLMRETSATLEW